MEPTLEREGTHALLTTGISVALGLTLSVIVSRTLGPAGKGLLDLTSATIALFTLVLGGSLNAALTHLIARERTLPAGLIGGLAVWGGAAAVVTLGFLAASPSFATRIGLLPATEPWFWIVFVTVSVGCNVWAAGLRGVLIGRQRVIAANRIDLAVKAGLLLAYLGLLLTWQTPNAFAMAGAGGAILLPALLVCALRGPATKQAPPWSALVTTALPLHATNILHFVNQRADIFFVQAQHGPSEVGLYALSVSLAQIVLLVSSALAQPLLPSVSAARSADEAADAAARTCRRYLVLALVASGTLALGAIWLVPLVFGRAFSGSLPALLILLPGVMAFGLTNLLISYFVGVGRSAINFWISIAALSVTIVGNLWLTRRLGGLGAALTSTCAYGLACGLSLFFFARASHLSALAALRPTPADWRDALTLIGRFRL